MFTSSRIVATICVVAFLGLHLWHLQCGSRLTSLTLLNCILLYCTVTLYCTLFYSALLFCRVPLLQGLLPSPIQSLLASVTLTCDTVAHCTTVTPASHMSHVMLQSHLFQQHTALTGLLLLCNTVTSCCQSVMLRFKMQGKIGQHTLQDVELLQSIYIRVSQHGEGSLLGRKFTRV